MYKNDRLYSGLWRPNEVDDQHFLFRFLMSYDHHYTISRGAYMPVRPLNGNLSTCYTIKYLSYYLQTYHRYVVRYL